MTPSQIVFGTTLSMPGEFVCNNNNINNNNIECQSDFVQRLRESIQNIRPPPATNHAKPATYVPESIGTATHVFMRIDRLKPALSAPYSGPHQVIERRQKYFIIDINGKKSKISVDRLKPAAIFAEKGNASSTPRESNHMQPSLVQAPSHQHQSTSAPKSILKKTKCGRVVKRPVRFADS